MTKKIKFNDYSKRVIGEANRLAENYNGRDIVGFSRIGGIASKNIVFGINWRAVGQVDVASAKWFAEFLKDTIEVVEKLNEEFEDTVIDWSKE